MFFPLILLINLLLCIHGYKHSFSRRSSLLMATGYHGENFKFMSILKGSSDDHFPRIVQIAGAFPGLTPEDIMAPSSTPAADPGSWTYSFPDPDDPNVGTIAVPGSEVMTDCIDPVAIIAKSSAMGVQSADGDVEMVVIIDRGDIDFIPGAFYAFQTYENEVAIMWADSFDDFNSILGKVVVCMMKADKNSKASSGFLEDE
jgi:hypothetical protein